MSYREKSAWVMGALLLAVGAFYASLVADGVPPPAAAVPFTMLVIVGSVILQIILAIASPKQAGAAADEREALIMARAGHLAGAVLAVGILVALGLYMLGQGGAMLFHVVLLSLIGAQVLEYGLQIIFLRRSF